VDFSFAPTAEVMPNSWAWNFASLGSSTQENPSFTFMENGTYVVTLSAQSADGCNISAVTTITVNPVPVADFGAHPDVVNTNDPQVNFDNNSTDASIWTWNFGDPSSEGLNYSALQNPVHDFLNPGTYTIELAVANPYGCVDTTTRTIVVREPFIFWIPNAFSPNGDMVNDYFGPTGTGIKEETFLMRIFDRWGKEIYFTVDFNAPWDGRNMRNGKTMFHGVFTYQIYIVDLSNHPHEFVGSVTLIE
jgi:gliding motility-associated-like protein